MRWCVWPRWARSPACDPRDAATLPCRACSSDPVRAVRIEAARALAGAAGARSAGESGRAACQAYSRNTWRCRRTTPTGPRDESNLGNFVRAAPRRRATAIAEYRKAIEIDPTFVAAYAVSRRPVSRGGSEGEVQKTLRQGIARNPREGTLHHALGLSLIRQKRSAEDCRNCVPRHPSRQRADVSRMSMPWRSTPEAGQPTRSRC